MIVASAYVAVDYGLRIYPLDSYVSLAVFTGLWFAAFLYNRTVRLMPAIAAALVADAAYLFIFPMVLQQVPEYERYVAAVAVLAVIAVVAAFANASRVFLRALLISSALAYAALSALLLKWQVLVDAGKFGEWTSDMAGPLLHLWFTVPLGGLLGSVVYALWPLSTSRRHASSPHVEQDGAA
jgi:hypothetical protein